MSAISTSGTLQFQPFTDTGYAVVGVYWDQIPHGATLHVGLNMKSQENAAVANQQNATALLVFGVSEGECPAGKLLLMFELHELMNGYTILYSARLHNLYITPPPS